jgi:hypothetical protein
MLPSKPCSLFGLKGAKNRLRSSGFGRNRIFQLWTGELWQQVDPGIDLSFVVGKAVEIYESDGKHYLKIEGQDEPVEVRRRYGPPPSWRRRP